MYEGKERQRNREEMVRREDHKKVVGRVKLIEI